MNVTIESSGNLVIAYLYGEIDHHTAAQLRAGDQARLDAILHGAQTIYR